MIPKIIIVEKSKHHIVFDAYKMPPKWAVTLISVMTYDVPTMKISLNSVYPSTNTVLDYVQWANLLGHIPLDSRQVDSFNYVTECDCEAGGPCCECVIQIQVTNPSETDELPVFSDDLITTDQRVLPVHRTFSVVSAKKGPYKQSIGKP